MPCRRLQLWIQFPLQIDYSVFLKCVFSKMEVVDNDAVTQTNVVLPTVQWTFFCVFTIDLIPLQSFFLLAPVLPQFTHIYIHTHTPSHTVNVCTYCTALTEKCSKKTTKFLEVLSD